MKKIIIASILVVGLAAGFAYAHGNGNGYGMRGGNHGMMGSNSGMMGGNYGMMGGNTGMMGGGQFDCPGANFYGQNSWSNESQQKFLEETTGIRKQMNDKRFEYLEAQRAPETTNQKLADIEKEMIDMHTQLEDKAKQYR